MWSSAPGFTVSFCEPDVRPVALAVIVGVPAIVSLYLKLALFVPEAIVAVVSWRCPKCSGRRRQPN